MKYFNMSVKKKKKMDITSKIKNKILKTKNEVNLTHSYANLNWKSNLYVVTNWLQYDSDGWNRNLYYDR